MKLARRTIACFSLMLLVCVTSRCTLADDEGAGRNTTQVKLLDHSVAGLAALNIYNTFGCIGLVSDLYKADKYDAVKVRQIMKDVVTTNDLAVQMLKNVEPSDKDGDIPVADLIACYRLLDREAGLLGEATKAKEKEQAMQRFQQAGDESWKKVRDVLGIEAKTRTKEEEK